MDEAKLAKIYNKGRLLQDKGDLQGAKQLFKKTLKYADNLYVRNNLAMTYYLSGDYHKALSTIKPVLSDNKVFKKPNPYTYALVSQIYNALGDQSSAKEYLDRAIDDFNNGLLQFDKNNVPDFFREYTVIIMRAAAKLRDHRNVFNLYRRWRGLHISWEAHYIGAVASYNMRDYKQAIRLLERCGEDDFGPILHLLNIATLVMQRELPHFGIGYKVLSGEDFRKMFVKSEQDEEYHRELMKDGYVRVMLLNIVLANDEDEGSSDGASQMIGQLVKHGGEWGVELGKRVLNSNVFNIDAKICAAQTLKEIGVYGKDEQIPAIIDGRMTSITVKTQEIINEHDDRLSKIVGEATKLKNEGKLDDAIALLEGPMEKGELYPPALLNLASYYRLDQRPRKALKLFKILEDVYQDDPLFSLNYSAFLLEIGNIEKAKKYYKNVEKASGIGEEFNQKAKILKDLINGESITPDEIIIEHFEESKRQDVENKMVPLNPSLSRGLKNMPAHWLVAACDIYGLGRFRRRKWREKYIFEYLTDQSNLEEVASKLSKKEKGILELLLENGGWCKISKITHEFGSMEGEGFFWSDRHPESPLALLWLKALVVVGRARQNNRRHKIATIPVELREPLRNILLS